MKYMCIGHVGIKSLHSNFLRDIPIVLGKFQTFEKIKTNQAEKAWYINYLLHTNTVSILQNIIIIMILHRTKFSFSFISHTYNDVGKSYGIFCASRNIYSLLL